jgi:hypothetical protein
MLVCWEEEFGIIPRKWGQGKREMRKRRRKNKDERDISEIVTACHQIQLIM